MLIGVVWLIQVVVEMIGLTSTTILGVFLLLFSGLHDVLIDAVMWMKETTEDSITARVRAMRLERALPVCALSVQSDSIYEETAQDSAIAQVRDVDLRRSHMFVCSRRAKNATYMTSPPKTPPRHGFVT